MLHDHLPLRRGAGRSSESRRFSSLALGHLLPLCQRILNRCRLLPRTIPQVGTAQRMLPMKIESVTALSREQQDYIFGFCSLVKEFGKSCVLCQLLLWYGVVSCCTQWAAAGNTFYTDPPTCEKQAEDSSSSADTPTPCSGRLRGGAGRHSRRGALEAGKTISSPFPPPS